MTTGKVLKERRAPRERGRIGSSLTGRVSAQYAKNSFSGSYDRSPAHVYGPDAIATDSDPNAGDDAVDLTPLGATDAMRRRATRQCPLGFDPCTQTICPGNSENRGSSLRVEGPYEATSGWS